MVFICNVEGCGKNFSCKKTLKEHERTHTGERPYSCAICQTTFAQYSSLQKHQRVHDKKKPYRCKYENCQQAFSQISNLIRHERIHTGEKPYACAICKKKFASGSNLKQHMQVHSNEETRIQYKCFVIGCEKGYLYLSSLKKHIQLSHQAEYETQVKTNKIDLNSCKEIVENIENHQYHDDEEGLSSHSESEEIVLQKRKYEQSSLPQIQAHQTSSKVQIAQINDDQEAILEIQQPSKRMKIHHEAAPQEPKKIPARHMKAQKVNQIQEIAQTQDSFFDQSPPPKQETSQNSSSNINGQSYSFNSFKMQAQETQAQQELIQCQALHRYESQLSSENLYVTQPQSQTQPAFQLFSNANQQMPFLQHVTQVQQLIPLKSQHAFQPQQPQQNFNPPKPSQQISVQNDLINDLMILQDKLQLDPVALRSVQLMVSKYTQVQAPPQASQYQQMQQYSQSADSMYDNQQKFFDPFRQNGGLMSRSQQNQNETAVLAQPQNEYHLGANNIEKSFLQVKHQDSANFSQTGLSSRAQEIEMNTQEVRERTNNGDSQGQQQIKTELFLSKDSRQRKYQFQSQPLRNHFPIKYDPKEEMDSLNQEIIPQQHARQNSMMMPSLNRASIQDIIQEAENMLQDKGLETSIQIQNPIFGGKGKVKIFKRDMNDVQLFEDQLQSTIESLPQLSGQKMTTPIKTESAQSCGSKSSCCGGGCSDIGSSVSRSDPKLTSERQQTREGASRIFRNLKNEQEENQLVDQMNQGFESQDEAYGFKVPYPQQNKAKGGQEQFNNQEQTLKFFSKLPCIKTCMSKYQFSDGKSKSAYKQIGFESLKDDFDDLSSSQHSTAACKHICDAQKLCPELMPSNCENYFDKKCNCTQYCKKALKYIQKFVKDEHQVAEIEDLCKVRDQLDYMAGDPFYRQCSSQKQQE